MNSPIPILLSFLILAADVLGASSRRAEEVLQAEQARVTALVSDDHATLDLLLSDDLTYTHSNASVDTKSEFLKSLTSGRLKYKALDHRDQHVRVYGDTAVLTGATSVHSVLDGNDIRITLRFTIVYAKKNGRWQMIAWQSTRTPN